MKKAGIENKGKEEKEVDRKEEESLKKEAQVEEAAHQGMNKTEEDLAPEDEQEDEVEQEDEKHSKKLSARVLKIHEIPKYKFDWVDLWLPQSKLNRRAYSQRIDLVEETALYLVAFLGRGGNGDVWFGITPDGERCCAVKFFFSQKSKTTAQLAQEECDKWNDVYGNDKNKLPSCHVGHLCDRTAYLCMPYIAPAPKRIWPMIVDPIFGAQDLEKALWKFAHAGYKQESLRLEHLGFFPVTGNNTKASEEAKEEDDKSQEATDDTKDKSRGGVTEDDEDGKEKHAKSHSTNDVAKGDSHSETDDDDADDDEDNEDQTLELYMFDLGRLSKFEENEDKEAWVQSSIQTLQAALPPLSVCNSMPWGHEGSFYEHLYSGY